jgi:hypothetical protein
METINTVSALDDLLGKTSQEPVTPEPETEPVVEPETEPEPSGGDPDLEPQPNVAGEPAPDPTAQKQNAAFAAMRAENSKLQRTFKNLASALGIKANSQDELLQQMERMAAEKLAGNIPVEFFMEHQQTQERLAAIEQERHNQTTLQAFNDVATQYKLSDKELHDFAMTLDAQGIKPFEQRGVDLHAHFFRMNSDRIIEQRTKAAVEAALRKDAAANTHASTPQASRGKGSTEEPKAVASVRELDAWFNSKN